MKRMTILVVVLIVFLLIGAGCYYPMFARVAAVVLAMLVFIVVACFLLLHTCNDDEY